MKKQLLLSFVALLASSFLAFGESLEISPDHSALRYVGRFTEDYRFGWTGSLIETEFQGASIEGLFQMTTGKKLALTVVIDGKETTLIIHSNQQQYTLAENLDPDQRHHITLFKRSEGNLGTLKFEGLQVPEGSQLFLPDTPDRKIMIIGDSITCGYGNEAASIPEGNTVENENGYQSYAARAARELNADLMMVCWSGKGIYRNYNFKNDTTGTLPKQFNRTLPRQESPQWDHSRFIPQLIVINLGTNDMSTHGEKPPLDKDAYVSAYKAFLDRLRAFAPQAPILLSIGPMAYDPVSSWLPEIAAEFENTSILIYSGLSDPTDRGGHWHPSVKKHRQMSIELVEKIKEITEWK